MVKLKTGHDIYLEIYTCSDREEVEKLMDKKYVEYNENLKKSLI